MVVEPPSKDVRSAMVRAQPEPVTITVGHVTMTAPPGKRPGQLKTLCQDLQRVFRDHSCREGRWEVVFEREHVSPADRGRG